MRYTYLEKIIKDFFLVIVPIVKFYTLKQYNIVVICIRFQESVLSKKLKLLKFNVNLKKKICTYFYKKNNINIKYKNI